MFGKCLAHLSSHPIKILLVPFVRIFVIFVNLKIDTFLTLAFGFCTLHLDLAYLKVAFSIDASSLFAVTLVSGFRFGLAFCWLFSCTHRNCP